MSWLTTQGNPLLANLADLAANRPEPARQVIVCTVATAVVAWVIFMILRKVS